MGDADALRAQVSILAVIGEHVQLVRKGNEYLGKCPFHKDDTPSFAVNAEKGLYHCYGCDAGGDIFKFIQEIEGVDFVEAKKRVAALAGLDPEEATRPRPPAPVVPISGMDGQALTTSPREVAVYAYTDIRERLLYEIVRKEWIEGGVRKKVFSQRYRDTAGKMIYLKCPNQVLYRLHRVGPADTVWLVEGEKDVLSLERLGLVATTNAGGSNSRWLKTYTETLAGKKVYLIPDNDAPGEKHMQRVYDAISGTSNAIVVRVPGENKSDVTDWLTAGGTLDGLMELAKQAEEKTEAERAAVNAVGRKKEPNEIAQLVMKDHAFKCTMDGDIYEYNDRFWELITNRRLRVFGATYDSDQHTNQRRRGEIADYIEIHTQCKRIEWRQVKQTEIALQNGVYDLATLELRPHRKEDYLETVVPVNFDPQADCPVWKRGLEDYFGDDPDRVNKIRALQQFFGYVLLPHARYKKALVLLGESDTGKSQASMLLAELVGRDNRCAVSVEDMDDPRKRTPIIGKLLNILTEITSKSVIADGGFKSLISTEEPLQFDPKFAQPRMYSPICKHVAATNVLPTVTDLTKGTYNRLLIIRFNRVLPKAAQDRNFLGKLIGELPGVLNWALSGAYDLWDSGGEFVTIAESQRLVEDYRRNENEINAFLEERCEIDGDAFVTAADVRDKFRTWAGRGWSDKSIGHMMKSAGYPAVTRGGHKGRIHVGLRWTV